MKESFDEAAKADKESHSKELADCDQNHKIMLEEHNFDHQKVLEALKQKAIENLQGQKKNFTDQINELKKELSDCNEQYED